MKHKLLDFENIKEIKFTRVSGDLFSISIESDISSESKCLENSLFEAKVCKIGSNSNLSFTMEDVYTNFMVGNEFLTSKYYEIILPIKLLVDINAKEIATITQKGENHDKDY